MAPHLKLKLMVYILLAESFMLLGKSAHPFGLSARLTNPKNHKSYLVDYLVVPDGHKLLLGAQAIQELNLVIVNKHHIMLLDSRPTRTSDIITEFHDMFEGKGRYSEQLHLEVDDTVPAVKIPVLKAPIAVRSQLKTELQRLVEKGITKPVQVPTDWISEMVVVRKRNGKVRLCIDPKPLNRILKRNHLPLPTTDDLLLKLAQAKAFSVLHAKNGFWHVELDEESSFLTTFGTPWGATDGLACPSVFHRHSKNSSGCLTMP